MDRLLFGDNQFFGVNHMSEEKARAQQMRFQDLDAIMEVLDAAYDEGVTTFMCTTHDRVAEICDVVRANPDRYRPHAVLPVHALRAQVRQRHHRRRALSARSASSCPTRVCIDSAIARDQARWPARTSKASPRCSSTPR